MTALASLLPLTSEDVERHADVIENEPLLPGFRLIAADAFPVASAGKS